MLRKLLILGICAGTSASLPIVYEVNPEAFLRYADAWMNDAPADPTAVAAVPPRVARAEPAATQQLAGRKVLVSADTRGHFTSEFKLNGRRIDAMVDTGATLVALNESTARKIGIKLSSSDFIYTVDTANGSAKAAPAVIGSLQIGRIHVENVQAVVLEDAALSGTLIGMSFLQRLGKFQVENGTLLLVQ